MRSLLVCWNVRNEYPFIWPIRRMSVLCSTLSLSVWCAFLTAWHVLISSAQYRLCAQPVFYALMLRKIKKKWQIAHVYLVVIIVKAGFILLFLFAYGQCTSWCTHVNSDIVVDVVICLLVCLCICITLFALACYMFYVWSKCKVGLCCVLFLYRLTFRLSNFQVCFVLLFPLVSLYLWLCVFFFYLITENAFWYLAES